jgi:hypothetical protein
MTIYSDNRGDANRQALEASPVAAAVWKLMQRNAEWNGTPTRLLKDLADAADEDMKQSRRWPSAPNVLSGEMKRLAPALRAIGIQAEDYREPTAERRRMWKLSHTEDESKGPSEASEASEDLGNVCKTNENSSDDLRTVTEGLGQSPDDLLEEDRPEESPAREQFLGDMDDLDDGLQLSYEDGNDDWAEGEA